MQTYQSNTVLFVSSVANSNKDAWSLSSVAKTRWYFEIYALKMLPQISENIYDRNDSFSMLISHVLNVRNVK